MEPNQPSTPVNQVSSNPVNTALPTEQSQVSTTTVSGEKKPLNKMMLIIIAVVALIIIIGAVAGYMILGKQKPASDQTQNTSLDKVQESTNTLSTLQNEVKSDQAGDPDKEFTAVDQDAQGL